MGDTQMKLWQKSKANIRPCFLYGLVSVVLKLIIEGNSEFTPISWGISFVIHSTVIYGLTVGMNVAFAIVGEIKQWLTRNLMGE